MIFRFSILLGLLIGACPTFAAEVPDTNQAQCYDGLKVVSCPSPGEFYYGQDGNYHSTPRSFTKLDAEGNDMPYSPIPSVTVRDNVTGLIWEVKTDDGSIHDKDNKFARCNQDSRTNGGDEGTCSSETPGGIVGHSQFFIDTLNENNFGGFNDWRIPTAYELLSLINWNSTPGSFWKYFPLAQGATPNTNWYLSNTWLNTSFDSGAVRVSAYNGSENHYDTYSGDYVRATRGTPIAQSVFINNGDTTVSDQTTGLMWQKSEGKDGTSYFVWDDARLYCENLTQAGYSDWRVPSVNEALTMIDHTYTSPALNTEIFEDQTLSNTWTSTTVAENPRMAWGVAYSHGSPSSNYKRELGHVRCVRGGNNTHAYSPQKITINVIGGGTVEVHNLNSDNVYYECEESCTLEYKEGIQVLLKALTNRGSSFVGWSEGCQTEYDGKCWVNVTGDVEFTARFGNTGDLNGDGQRGIAEVIMILQELTGN